MTRDHELFRQLLDRVRAGSGDAVAEFCATYGRFIVRAVRKQLTPRARRWVDSTDVTQDVWKSFFEDLPRRLDFDSPAALRAFLIRTAEHKAVDLYRRRRESQPLPTPLPGGRDDTTPSQVAIAAEQWQRLMARTPPRYHPVLQLLSEGRSYCQVAATVGVSERTVRRLVRHLEAGVVT